MATSYGLLEAFAQLTVTCLKSTMETLLKGVKLFKVNNKNASDVILVFLLLTMNNFTPFSSVSIIDFKQINVSWILCQIIYLVPLQ